MKKNSKTKIISSYSKALFAAALENKELELVYAGVSKLAKGFSMDDIISISNPILEYSVKEDILEEISKKYKLSYTLKKSMLIILENNRFKELLGIFDAFHKLYYKHMNLELVNIQSIKQLSLKQEKSLQEVIEKIINKKVIFNYELNPNILGGLVVNFSSYQIDDSIKGKLFKLENIMKGL